MDDKWWEDTWDSDQNYYVGYREFCGDSKITAVIKDKRIKIRGLPFLTEKFLAEVQFDISLGAPFKFEFEDELWEGWNSDTIWWQPPGRLVVHLINKTIKTNNTKSRMDLITLKQLLNDEKFDRTLATYKYYGLPFPVHVLTVKIRLDKPSCWGKQATVTFYESSPLLKLF